MANKKRAANRRRSESGSRGMVGGSMHENRESAHMESGGYGAGSRSRSSGSIAHIGETRGPGPVAGAGELFNDGGASRAGPGRGARGYAGASGEDFPSTDTPSGKTPPGMKTQMTDE
jgi:hypothetical protein